MSKYLFLVVGLLLSSSVWAAQCQGPQKATLFWDAPQQGPTYTPVDHVEIWRADGTCNANSTFTPASPAFAADIIQWDDLNVVAGQTYCWVGYSFDATGNKSGPSNTAECDVPLFPLDAPKNLRVQ